MSESRPIDAPALGPLITSRRSGPPPPLLPAEPLDADRACAQRLRVDALEVRKLQRALRGLRQLHRAYAERDQNARQVRALIQAEREQRVLLEEATLREAAAYERGVRARRPARGLRKSQASRLA